jgi:hypothetical protein
VVGSSLIPIAEAEATMTKSKRLSATKLRWKRRVLRIAEASDKICSRFEAGEHIGMGELYFTARRAAQLGDAGEELRAKVNRDITKRVSVMNEGIAAVCKLLENISAALLHIVDAQGTPVVDFPVYESKLRVTSEVETSSLDALEKVMAAAREE